MVNENDTIGDETSSVLDIVARGAGYIGAVCLFIGGLSAIFPVPLVGQITFFNGPSGSGILYILLAALSMYLVYSGRLFLLYLTGGLAALTAGLDILNRTRLGYIVNMVLGGGLSGGMGGAQDPIVTGMMQNPSLSIPTGWVLIGAGILILLITPSLKNQKSEEKSDKKDVDESILHKRLKELDNLIQMYERGHISKEEFHQLKNEIMNKKIRGK